VPFGEREDLVGPHVPGDREDGVVGR
jgi:hypothetical protein